MEVILILKLEIFIISTFEKAHCSKHTMPMIPSFSMLHILKSYFVSIIVDIFKLSCSANIKS